MHFTKQSHWGMYYFMTHIYIHAFTHTNFFWWKAFYDTYPCMFSTSIFMLHPTYMHIFERLLMLPTHKYAYFERHFFIFIFCYLSNIYKFLKGIFATYPTYTNFWKAFFAIYLHTLQGISCYIFTHFARHFFMLYIFTYFARYFHAIYIHICTYYWKAFFMLPRCKVVLMRQQIQILV